MTGDDDHFQVLEEEGHEEVDESALRRGETTGMRWRGTPAKERKVDAVADATRRNARARMASE